MYQVGDRVVHPMHGAGIIESIVQERLGGQLGSYYVFRMPSGGLTLKIPTGSCGAIGVRALSTSGRIREVLSAIPGLEIDRTTNWNRRYRENLNRLKSGDLLEVARVIKGLMWRDRERAFPTVSARCSTAPNKYWYPRWCWWRDIPIPMRSSALSRP